MRSDHPAGIVRRAAWLAVAGFMAAGTWSVAAAGDESAESGDGRKERHRAGCAGPSGRSGRCDAGGPLRRRRPRACGVSRRRQNRPTRRLTFRISGGSPSALGADRDAARALLRKASKSTPRADGRSRSATSSRESSWLRGTGRPPKSWPVPRPSGCSRAIAKISSPESTTTTPAGCSSPATR